MQLIWLFLIIFACIHVIQSAVSVYKWPAIGRCPQSLVSCVDASGAKLVRNTEGCWRYTCLHPCLTKKCGAGFVCKETPVPDCILQSCEIVAACVPFVKCELANCDANMCPVSGFAKDVNQCNICKCADPCAELKCGDNGCSAVLGNDGNAVFSCAVIDY